jgi:hypothetical protein
MKGIAGPDTTWSVAVTTPQKDDKSQSGNQGFYDPINYGRGVNEDDPILSPMLNSPTGFMQQAFPGALDPGTPVIVLKQLGELGGIILGQSNTVRKGGQNGGGGGRLGSAETVSQFTQTTRDVNVAPDIQEVEENGVKIRKIKEKGQQHSLDLLEGLPIHGALFDMAGFRLPEITNVPTAKQTNDGMIGVQQMQQMMGQVMSLGQMIQGLAGNKGGGGGAGGFGAGSSLLSGAQPGQAYTPPGANTGAGGAGYGGGLGDNIIFATEAPPDTPLYTIMEGLTTPMKSAVNSLSLLLQGYEANDGVAFMTGDVVHEDTYLKNAQELLSQVTSLSELMYVLNRLQWDTDLFGQDKIEPVINEIETAWGVALQKIDVNGNVVITYGYEDANAEMEFANTMTSNTGSPALGFFDGNSTTDVFYSVNATGASLGFIDPATTGASGIPSGGSKGGTTDAGQVIGQAQGLLGQIEGLAQGMSQNMFGEAAGTMKELWKRMTREQENDAKKMHEKLNTSGDTQNMSQIVEKTVKGGNPVDKSLLKKDDLETNGDAVGQGNFTVGTM